MSTYELLSVIFAGIASFGSVATAASVAAAFISHKKNQVNKKTLIVDFVCLSRKVETHSISYYGTLTLINATTHSLTICYAALSANEKEYPFSFRQTMANVNLYTYVPINDITLSGREIKHMNGFFDLPSAFPNAATLKVVTSFGTFTYPISLQSLQEKARYQEAESNHP